MSDVLRSSGQHIFGAKFANDLLTLFGNSNETLRTFIIGSFVLVITASNRVDRLLAASRLATFPGAQLPACGALSADPAAFGLFLDDGGLCCFHCGGVVYSATSRAAAAAIEVWAAHLAVRPGCYLARLGHRLIASSELPADTAVPSDAARFLPLLRRLRQLLDSPALATAASYGFELAYLRLCAGRHFMLNSSGAAAAAALDKPGELIRLAQQAEADGLPEAAGRIDLLRIVDCALVSQEVSPAAAAEEAARASASAFSQPSSSAVATVATDSLLPESDEADDQCVLCRSRSRNRVTLPCAHFLLCDRCLDTVSRCPKCQQPIVATVTAFIT